MTMEDTLQNIISVNDKLMSKLQSKRQEVEDFQKACLIAKTAGTSTATIGTVLAVVGVIGAPVTAGASLALTVGGMAATAAGVATNVVTDDVDNKKTKEFVKQIDGILKDRDKVLGQLADQLESIAKQVIDGIAAGLSPETALKAAFVIKCVSAPFAAFTINQLLTLPEFAVHLGRKCAVDADIIRTFPKAVNALKQGMLAAGRKSLPALLNVTGKLIAAAKVAGRVMAAAGVVIQVCEIKNLVEAWQKNHPTVEAIDSTMKQLTDETTSCKELLQAVQNIVREYQLLQPIEQLAPVLATKVVLQTEVESVLRYFREDPQDYMELVKNSCLLETGEDVRKLTESLLAYALVRDANGGVEDFSKEWGQIKRDTGNKKKTKVQLMELFKNVLKMAEDAWNESKGKDRKKKRGDHVINLGVLSVYPDIIARFVEKHHLDQYQGRIPDIATIHVDRTDPLGSAGAIIKRMIVFLDLNRPPDVNCTVYGRTVEILIDTCLNHMTEIYGNPARGLGSHYTAMIRELVNQIVTLLVFVDIPARERWLAGGPRNVMDYEGAENAVINMFRNLHDKLHGWVQALKNARDIWHRDIQA